MGKTSVSNALANKENEIFTLNASPLEKSCSKNAQKNSSTDLKMVALKSAENQPQVGGCAVSTDFVGRISVEIEGMFCETEQDFQVNMCSGDCVSSTVNKDGKMEKQCSCCSAAKTIERQVSVKCADGTVRTHTVEFVEECSCGVTKCEAEKFE